MARKFKELQNEVPLVAVIAVNDLLYPEGVETFGQFVAVLFDYQVLLTERWICISPASC